MNLYVIGDSISIQYGPYLERQLQGNFHYARKEGTEEALQNLDIPKGANGGHSTRVLEFLEAMHSSNGIDADVLLLNCGLHDIKLDPETGVHQIPLEAYQSNLNAIVQRVAEMGLYLVWVRITPFDEDLHNQDRDFYRFESDGDAYNQAADEIMAAAGVPCIDLYTFTLNLGKDLYADHVHFRPEIQEKQAAYIAGWLSNPAFRRQVAEWKALHA